MLESYDQNVGNFTTLVNKNLIHFLNLKLSSFDITAEQWQVLLTLSKQNKISQRVLSELVHKNQPTLTRMLDILVRKQLVERHANEGDRRAFSIHITQKGMQLTEELIPFLENIFSTILKDISKEDLIIYINVLNKINENISNSSNS